MLFGLACEGVTDQITLENILCGYFENGSLGQEIGKLQPLFDETDQKQKDFGGWNSLFAYLRATRFRDDVFNNHFIVIHVDTDVCNEKGFDVPQVDIHNNPLPAAVLVAAVIEKLVTTINDGELDFYQGHLEKIIFCISVHSLECWLYAHHNKKRLSNPKITGCYKALSHLDLTVEKTYRCYDQLSRGFLERKNIDAAAQKAPSFSIFIDALDQAQKLNHRIRDCGH